VTPNVSNIPAAERVSAFIEPGLRRALEASAAEHDRSLSAELRTALRQYLAVDPGPGGTATVRPGER